MNNCCHTYRAVRWIQGTSPKERFTCPTCGTSYVWRNWQWEKIGGAEDIKDMMEEEKKRHGA